MRSFIFSCNLKKSISNSLAMWVGNVHMQSEVDISDGAQYVERKGRGRLWKIVVFFS